MATLKQSTAYTRTFLMILASDHVSPATGLVPVVTISKAGGAFGAPSVTGNATEIANGWYKIGLSTTDTATLGDLAYHAAVATADNTDFVDQVFANILGDTLPSNVLQWNGTNVASPATAGIPEVNVKNFGATAVTGRDIGASVIVGTNNDKTGYGLSSSERNSVSDALLDRDMSSGSDSGSPTVRTVRQALRALRNKLDTSTGAMNVYKEDDSTVSWTAALTTNSSAVPITTVDPAGP